MLSLIIVAVANVSVTILVCHAHLQSLYLEILNFLRGKTRNKCSLPWNEQHLEWWTEGKVITLFIHTATIFLAVSYPKNLTHRLALNHFIRFTHRINIISLCLHNFGICVEQMYNNVVMYTAFKWFYRQFSFLPSLACHQKWISCMGRRRSAYSKKTEGPRQFQCMHNVVCSCFIVYSAMHTRK